ncbi:hypothetical protein HZC00_03875 [Candidatus Kaiserbacteria bacterium]|nr:hypothetical protein [Candidatus Kaiserbacteria bacterium]
MKTLLTVLAVAGVLVLMVAGSYIGYGNYGNEAEQGIKAEYTNMENILAQGGIKVREVAQVPGMYADDLERVAKAAISARYGSEGSKAAMQWIKEGYPGKMDPSLYKQIQQVIESYRDKFQNEQTKFIDTKRAYETNLGYFWTGFWLRTAGYPKIDLAKYVIISSDDAQEAFKTGKDKAIKLR